MNAPATSPRPLAALLAIAVVTLGVTGTSQVTAASAAPAGGWTVGVLSTPTVFAPGDNEGRDGYVLTVTNTSGHPTDGSTITVADILPAGITPVEEGISGTTALSEGFEALSCQTTPLQCSFTGVLAPGDSLLITIPVNVAASMPASVTSTVTVSGGGIAGASVPTQTSIDSTPAGYGIPAEGFQVVTSTTQAGAHPDLTTVADLTSARHKGEVLPIENPKDLEVSLPPGLLANANALPQCSTEELIGPGGLDTGLCPPDTQVGTVTIDFINTQGFKTLPVYNMVPQPGEPARFGFYAILAPVFIVPHVRSDGDYGATASLTNAAEALPFVSSILTLWGVPTDPIHDSARKRHGRALIFGASSGLAPTAFTINPTSCSGPLAAGVATDGWQAIGSFAFAGDTLPGEVGCTALAFHPSIATQPDTPQAGVPAGYGVELKVPQSNDPAGLATPTLRDATVTLPQGTVISPSAADGLQACSDNAASPAGDQFGLHSLTPASCPQASQIGTVEVHTPLLANPLEGQMFVGQPACTGPGGSCTASDAQGGNMIRLFLQVQGSGVIVKLEGHGFIDQGTGRLTTSFTEDPQLPFDDLKLTLKGGPRAPLANPSSCGAAETSSDLTPWSSPLTPDATPNSVFAVAGCAPAQFAPGFTAGTTNNRVAAFSPLTTTITRSDADQALGGVGVTMPPGLLGILKNVTRCPEPQAATGACPASSQIGHVIVGAGPGAQPVYLPQAGRAEDPVFLTGPYAGAPFGLTIVDHAEAGPFNLGTIVVRARIIVDMHTAQIEIVSDPLPTIRDGVLLALRTIHVVADRPDFIFNPTSCSQLAVNGTLASAQGASTSVSSRFQAADCAALGFHPSFKVATAGSATAKGSGASLRVDLTAAEGPQGNAPALRGESNIKRVDVQLPKALPARLTTLQHACTAAQFAANPAGCPPESLVGTAVAHSPVLASPLSGPAILVSHGGAAFPDLTIVLQGEGVTLDLTGGTLIKRAITSSTFDTVPDAPISSFELNLPRGPHSALASSVGSLCGRRLTMPTTMEGQNGAVVKQSTRISVSGCHAKRHRTRPPKHRKR